jgi:hypothetical protein
MAQQMMWSQIDQVFRGQASDGTVITVEEDAMLLAHKKAGNSVYESDWWPETLTRVLEHWGIYGKRWVDDVTFVPRIHFTKGEPKQQAAQQQQQRSGPLSTRLLSSQQDTERLD